MRFKILNLGCGRTRIANSIGIDFIGIPGFVDVVHNLNNTPYPFDDDYFDEIHAYHVIEHLDNVNEIMTELYRILKKDGKIFIRAPHFSSMGAFTDITHKRPYGVNSFDVYEQNHPMHYYSGPAYKILFKKISFFGLTQDKGFRWKYANPTMLIRLLSVVEAIINNIININHHVYERFFCHILGGATEIRIILKK